MNLFLKLHQLAEARGDGLRPEWVNLLVAATSADDAARTPVGLSVVQPGNHPDGVPVVPAASDPVVPQQANRQRTG
jgi:hypothetical protein